MMDNNVTRGGYDKVHYCWANQSHPVILLDKAGGPHSNVVALHYLCRAVASSSGEENDGPKSGWHREEFRGIL